MRARFLARLAAVGLGACGLAACTPLQWQHPLYGTANLEADLAACDRLAERESWRMSEPTPAFPHVYTLPSGQRVVDPYPRFPSYGNTGELRNFCMRAKGYELVPVPEAAAQ